MVGYLEQTATEILNPLVALWNSFVEIVPGLVAALVILLIGYILGLLIGHAVRVVLEKAGLDKWLVKASLDKAIGHIRMSSLLGLVVKWYILIIFLQAAVDAVNLGTLSVVLNEFVLWLPHLIVSLIVVLAGIFIAHYTANIIEKHTEMKGAKFMSTLFKVLIVFISVLIALQQIGIEVSILEQLLLIAAGALGLGIALAIGLSFGLGMQKNAPNMWNAIKKFF